MKINKNDYDFICKAMDSYPQLSHASNIITKCSGKRSTNEERALELLIPEYAKYLRKILNIKKFDEEAIYEKVALLNAYYNYMHTNGLDQAFSSQGKFRPTILEEFLFLLFKDYVTDIKEKKIKTMCLIVETLKRIQIFISRRKISSILFILQKLELMKKTKIMQYIEHLTFPLIKRNRCKYVYLLSL